VTVSDAIVYLFFSFSGPPA